MNKVILIGRLTADPEVNYKDELAMSRFTLAVNREFKKGEADFITCKAFSKTAEFIEKYYKKGMRVAVTGRWQTGSFTKNTGDKVYTNDCIIEQTEFCEDKKDDDKKDDSNDGFVNIPDGIVELPFG